MTVAVLAGVGATRAADVVWQGPANTPSNYGTASNWVGNTVPGSGDDAVVNNNGIVLLPNGYTNTVADIRTGDNTSSSGAFSLIGGSLTVTGHAYFANNTGSTGGLSISAGTLNLNSGSDGELDIGGDGAGTLNMSGGTINSRYFYMGAVTHGSGVGTQTGGTINVVRNFVMAELKPADSSAAQTASTYAMSGGTITVGGEMYVGAHGPSSFTLSNTGYISVANTLHIGTSGSVSDPPAGSGTLNMSGGTLNIVNGSAHFVIADHGDGTFNFSGGNVTTDFYNIGQNFEFGSSTRGVVNQTGGTATVNLAWVIGEVSRSANLYDLSGGTVNVIGSGGTNPGDLNVASGSGARGTLQVRGTGKAFIGNNLNVGNAATTSGTLSVADNGVLAVGNNGTGTSTLIIGVTGTGYLQISGGTVSTDSMTLGQNAGGLGTGSQTGGLLTVRSNLSIGEASTGANAYSISGGTLTTQGIYVGTTGKGTLNVSGTATVTASTSFEDAQTGSATINVSGGSLTAPSFVNRGLYTQSAGSASLGAITGTGTIATTGGTLRATSISQGTLTIGGGTVAIAANGTNTATSLVNSLTVTTGKLDVANNTLIDDYTGTSPLSAISANIKSGYNAGAWNGNGIITSRGNSTRFALGYGEASAIPSAAGGTYAGQTVDNTSVIVKYTYFGDANLDGSVDAADFVLLSNNFGATNSVWTQGNFNYDNTTNAADFVLLSNNFGSGPSGLGMSPAELNSYNAMAVELGFNQSQISAWDAQIAAVPEPACLTLVAGAMLLAGRRRK